MVEASAGRTLSVEELRRRVAALPRVRLAALPTPLDDCTHISATLGKPRILVKRDDLTGLAFGGNKTRQLEFIFAAVLAAGADCVVAGAYTQSNWCRQITAAACKLGLSAHLVLAHGEKGPRVQGNLLLDRLMGADIEIVDTDDEGLQPLLEAKTERLRAAGRRPYLISSFDIATQSLAAIGYVEAAAEIVEQVAALGSRATQVYIAGAEMSPAGLALGLHLLGESARVMGISPVRYRLKVDRAADIAGIANAAARRLGCETAFGPGDIINDDSFIGPRYGVVSEAGLEAMKLLARLEGILLDPVYSSKAFSAVVDHVRKGIIGKDDVVVFVHTGGSPALFAYAEDLNLT